MTLPRPPSLKPSPVKQQGQVGARLPGYARDCVNVGTVPTKSFDPTAHSLQQLYDKWRKVS